MLYISSIAFAISSSCQTETLRTGIQFDSSDNSFDNFCYSQKVVFMLWRASAFMAIRHHSITSALYPIRDGASPGDRLIIGRADFSSDIFCYSQTKCLCPEWASSFSVFAYSAMNAYALESIGVYGYSPSFNHFCPLPNKRRCQFWRPSHYWKGRLILPTYSVTHRQNAYAPSGHPLSAFSLIQRGSLCLQASLLRAFHLS